ncbi:MULTISPECIES: S-formylglutathione hydrolase [Carnobacterium]|jgi:S-formylglutathione hydrolase|uniref:S-formylglutathione hydrolase n=2 Tax=Carnobacterium inhibens TaxID=147709 RepID=U5SEF1_9LACT|nr:MULTISPECIES: S-formylglutathione hydrolase [Carnobacterium]AGY82503.1 S-formylglutathione hydrolase [Carnobacterium inhibens subsp. gilichinskyi]MBC9825495.1 S-formylglutathione hydrolase [Carnobacterium inhibens]MCM3512062.1 S-formylglutathione hydrolase [Carnobacterium inhibens]MDN5372105.1 S-formylglutathione hydrolase [Carnobacterium sp.]
MVVEQLEMHLSFQGEQRKYHHFSKVLNCDMVFSLYLPPSFEEKELSLIWWLSGLTCTDDNFSQKSGFQKAAADQTVAVIIPDTSPRGDKVPDDEGWDLGKGASFYLNATQDPWVENYQMYTYLTEELPQIVYSLIPHFSGKESIMGHSMGGHGAIMMGLKERDRFASISAFAPILNPSQVPWGQKAFTAYLGSDESSWQEWDSTSLIEQTEKVPPILITQGMSDNFYEVQLQEKEFLKAAGDKPVFYRSEKGYDHSYFTIATFIEEHIQFHVNELKK